MNIITNYLNKKRNGGVRSSRDYNGKLESTKDTRCDQNETVKSGSKGVRSHKKIKNGLFCF